MFPWSPHEEDMEATQRGMAIPPTMVENVGRGEPLPQRGWADWAGLKQRIVGKTTLLFHVILEQFVSNQNTANLKLWDMVTMSLEVNPQGG